MFNKIIHPLILPKSAFISLNIISSNKIEQQILVREMYSVTAIQGVKKPIHFSDVKKYFTVNHCGHTNEPVLNILISDIHVELP